MRNIKGFGDGKGWKIHQGQKKENKWNIKYWTIQI